MLVDVTEKKKNTRGTISKQEQKRNNKLETKEGKTGNGGEINGGRERKMGKNMEERKGKEKGGKGDGGEE